MKKLFTLFGIVALTAASAQTARVQVIHNSADLAADSVDVYLDTTLLLDNFAFRTATEFIDAPADSPITIGIAPKTSTGVSDTIYSLTATLTSGETYAVVANGIVSPNGYSPSTPFDLYIYPMARESASQMGNTDILVFHGSTDAPIVSIDVAGVGTVVDTLMYGEFEGYLEVATADVVLEVRSEDGATLFASYSAPLSSLSLQDEALVAIASGFLDPSSNSNGAGFGLWVALPAGGPLVELPVASGLSVAQFDNADMRIYPNPAKDIIHLEGVDASQATLIDMTGKRVKVWNDVSGQLNVNDINAGVYILRVNSEEKTFTTRVVIQ